MRDKRLSDQIQENMYEKRMRILELLGGKSREYWIKKANTKIIKI
jgi:hypothetical protein